MSNNSLFTSPRGHQSAGGSSSSSASAHNTASSSSSSLAENHDTQTISPFQQQQQTNAEPLNNGSSMPHHPPPSPLSSQRDEHGIITTPPLLKRRAYSYDLGGHAVAAVAGGQFSVGVGGGGSASGNTNRDDDTAMNIHGLRTIPSRCEMDNDELLNNGDENDDYSFEVTRRHTLYATPTRRRGRGSYNYNYHSSRQQRHHQNNNRSRSVSSDVILNCLPRYDDELAARIATISHADAQEVDVDTAAIQQPAPQRGEHSFFTPERRPTTTATRMYLNRDRANTCPHRPQRHSIFFHQQNDDNDSDEQHHGTNGNGGLEFGEGDEESGPLTTTLNGPLDISEYETPELTSPSRLVASTPDGQRSFGRRASPAVPLLNLSSSFLSPSSVATPSSARRATRPSSLVSPSSSSSAAAAAVVIPNSPQATITNTNTTSRTPLASRTPSSSSQQQPLSPITTPLQQDQNNNCSIHRINPHLMKFLMILSLYILLAYTWNTDFSQRYKSMEINYGLSEYWHGEVLLSVSSDNNHNKGMVGGGIMGGKHSRGDKLFVDDANNIGIGVGVDDNIAKLLINGEDSGDDTTTITNSGSKDDDVMTAHAHANTATLVSSLEGKNSNNNNNNNNHKKQQRPYLSYARSSNAVVSDTYHPAYGISNIKQRRGAYNTTTTKSLNSKFQWVFWGLVWMAFMIPIVEAGVREVRRQVNIRFWNVRRLRSFRAMPMNHRGGHNVHNL